MFLSENVFLRTNGIWLTIYNNLSGTPDVKFRKKIDCFALKNTKFQFNSIRYFK